MTYSLSLVRPYQTLDELYEALLSGEVDGILLDAYVVGSRKDLFKNPDLLVNKIKDYRSAYGIVWAGRSARMKVCLDWYMKTRRSEMFYHVADNLHMVRKVNRLLRLFVNYLHVLFGFENILIQQCLVQIYSSRDLGYIRFEALSTYI